MPPAVSRYLAGGRMVTAPAAIHRLTKNAICTVPDPETLRGLAAALDVSIDRVAVAALRSAAVSVTDRFAAGNVLEGLNRLTPLQRHAIRRLVEAMIDPRESSVTLPRLAPGMLAHAE